MFLLYKFHLYYCFNPTSNFLDLDRAMGNEQNIDVKHIETFEVNLQQGVRDPQECSELLW